MNWKNIDLTSESEQEFCLIDPLTFSRLLLEVDCNCQDIDEESVRKQFEETLRQTVEDARYVFKANLANITGHANRIRNS